MSEDSPYLDEEAALYAAAAPVLRLPVPCLSVQFPKAAKLDTNPHTMIALLWGDVHYPFQDERAVRVVEALAALLQPTLLVCMGDLVDAALLSEKFRSNPERTETLQDEIDGSRFHLARMRYAAPSARFVLLEGNHENRLTRVLWNMFGPAAALAALTNVKKELTWPRLLGLEELDIEFVPYEEQGKNNNILPGHVVKHGSIVRQNAGYTANAEFRKYGRSGASGHTHRLSLFSHRNSHGYHAWLETGTLMKLNPEYTSSPDWLQGCVVVTIDIDSGARSYEPVVIDNGIAIFRGQVLRATPDSKAKRK
jgi:hypothetical protein